MPIHDRRGLTLVELLVVLAILAIMTTIAVVSTDQLVDQGRYNATQRTLQNIQDAIIGPANQRAADGSLLITGYVADMGGLPQPVDTTRDPLCQLWDPTAITTLSPAPVPPMYGIQTVLNIFTVYPPTTSSPYLLTAPGSPFYVVGGATVQPVTTTQLTGWRGPYLQFPVGSGGKLLDGWGNPFDSLQSTTFLSSRNSPATVGSPILAVRSLGADNAVDNPASTIAPYNLDQYVPTQTTTPPPSTLASFTNLIATGSGISVSGQVLAYTNAATAASSVTSATYTGGVVTLTVSGTFTAAAPGQQSITVANVVSTGAPAGSTGFNGTFSVQSVNATGSGATQITYNLATSPGTYSSGGTVTALMQPTVGSPVAVGATDAVIIVLFAPVNGVLTAFPVLNLGTTPTVPYFPCGTSITFAFPTTVVGSTSAIQSIQLGPRAIQAFQFDLTTNQVRKRTPLLNLMVPPGGVPFQTLILPLNVEASF